MEEDFAVELLAERLRRFVRPAGGSVAPEFGLEAAGASRAGSLRDGEPPSRSTDAIDLSDVWSAVEMVRAEVDGESDPALRASLHRRLDKATLDFARAALGRATDANRRAIEDISHDIRSPLNSMLLLTDSLLHGHGGPLNSAQHRQVSVLLTAAVALVRLVNDVMDASRLDSGRDVPAEPAIFSMNELLTEAKRLVSPLAVHRSVDLVFDPTTEQRVGDRQLLCRVLINLASNAVEEAGEGGTVEVRLDGSGQDWLRVDIIDTGDQADIDILQRMIAEDGEFYPRYHQGWVRGLGLAISGRLVRKASGDLSVGRLADGRTCFSVKLPFPRT
ncbi:MAG: HAMP domain-containing sensor histidine kinase [Gemmatimonadales bacterium]